MRVSGQISFNDKGVGWRKICTQHQYRPFTLRAQSYPSIGLRSADRLRPKYYKLNEINQSQVGSGHAASNFVGSQKIGGQKYFVVDCVVVFILLALLLFSAFCLLPLLRINIVGRGRA
jgi:hypothetical protein